MSINLRASSRKSVLNSQLAVFATLTTFFLSSKFCSWRISFIYKKAGGRG
jgi:hypothetical protein